MPYANLDQRREYARLWVKKRRDDYYREKCCARVQCSSMIDLELHHTDPTIKVSHKIFSWSKARRDAELQKCIVLCHDCHLQETIKQLTKEAEHGTTNRYYKGCKCQSCKTAFAQYAARLRLTGRTAAERRLNSLISFRGPAATAAVL